MNAWHDLLEGNINMLTLFEGNINMPASGIAFALTATLVMVLFVFQQLTGKGKITVKARCNDDRQDFENTNELLRKLGVPSKPHEEGSMIPCRGIVISNATSEFENEFCKGKFLSLHRATYDAKLDRSCDYQYGDYFRGKKRLWEARFQVQFEVPPPPSDVFFGIELEQYVPMAKTTKKTMNVIISLLKRVVGDRIYHTPGDDPAVVYGDKELPAFVMPLFAFDQYIVTPSGKIPPELSDPNIPSMGSCRSKRVKQYQKEFADLTFIPGYTYTFCFWGISQWLDKINWTVRLPLANLDFNLFCGCPPVHVVLYTLKKHGGSDRRHLAHLKRYYFDMAFWSSESRPEFDRIHSLLGEWARSANVDTDNECLSEGAQTFPEKLGRAKETRSRSAGIFGCCSAR